MNLLITLNTGHIIYNDITSNINKARFRNIKGGSITVPLASCLTGLESAV